MVWILVDIVKAYGAKGGAVTVFTVPKEVADKLPVMQGERFQVLVDEQRGLIIYKKMMTPELTRAKRRS